MQKKYLLFIVVITCMFQGCKGADKPLETSNVFSEEVKEQVKDQETDTEIKDEVETKEIEELINSETDIKEDIVILDESEENIDKDYYRLEPPVFIDYSDISLCPLAQEYIALTYNEFSDKYSAEQLWSLGVFNQLLFTKEAENPIINDISIGDSKDKVITTFGKPQFGTSDTYNPDAEDYRRFLLCGYKTPDYYFAFQINVETDKVESICIRKRYPLPDDKTDILKVLVQCSGWYGTNTELENRTDYFNDDTVEYTQLGRGSMSMMCKYGFISTSGAYSFDNYCVYADFEGDIPKLSMCKDEFTDSDEKYDPVYIYIDYPEELIYNVYTYLSQQDIAINTNVGVCTSDGNIIAYAVNYGNVLDFSKSSGLYETAHVVIHWMNGEEPDRQIYLGHYSSVIGYINDRYLIESNMLGLHVYDIVKDELVYWEDAVFAGRDDFSINSEKSCIVDSDNNVWYRYEFDDNDTLIIERLLEY